MPKSNKMRIVSGKYRHRLISYPMNDPNIRPTKDRVREAIFSIIGDISNKVILDLYSGSGALAVEALSRNAKKAFLVDSSTHAIEIIKENVKSLNIPREDYEILFKSDLEAIDDFKKREIKFDIIFLDPPYQKGRYEEIISLLVNNGLLAKDSLIVIESSKEVLLPNIIFKKRKDYRYGITYVTVLGM